MLSVAQEADYLVEVDGAVHRISGGEAGIVRAPAPAMVVALPVTAGQTVAEGDTLAIVESMKLETSLRAPFDGTVAEILVPANTQVDGGTKLVRLEPSADADSAAPSGSAPTCPRSPRPAPTPTRRDRGRRAVRAALPGAGLRRRRAPGPPAAAPPRRRT